MSNQLKKDRTKLGKELRTVFVETLDALMSTDPKIVALEADLGGASGFSKLAGSHGDKFINVGISEANMIGIASGLSLTGYIPFCHTFAPFATRRVFDQLFLSGGYAKTSFTIFGSDPGFAVGANGGTHTSFEDVALMRMIPNTIICDPADGVQLDWIIRELAHYEGLHYIRANRKSVREVYETGASFEIGKGHILKKGAHVVIFVAGQLVSEALDISEDLSSEGIHITVVDMFTIKPLDQALVIELSKTHDLLITIENHAKIGGLGSAIADVITEANLQVALLKIGIEERFGEVGSPDYLQDTYGLSKEKMIEKIKTFIEQH